MQNESWSNRDDMRWLTSKIIDLTCQDWGNKKREIKQIETTDLSQQEFGLWTHKVAIKIMHRIINFKRHRRHTWSRKLHRSGTHGTMSILVNMWQTRMGMEPFQSGCVSDDSQRVCLCRVASSTNKVSREMGRCIQSTVPLGSWLFFSPQGSSSGICWRKCFLFFSGHFSLALDGLLLLGSRVASSCWWHSLRGAHHTLHKIYLYNYMYRSIYQVIWHWHWICIIVVLQARQLAFSVVET